MPVGDQLLQSIEDREVRRGRASPSLTLSPPKHRSGGVRAVGWQEARRRPGRRQGGHDRRRFPAAEGCVSEPPFAMYLTPAWAPRLRAPLLVWHLFDYIKRKFRFCISTPPRMGNSMLIWDRNFSGFTFLMIGTVFGKFNKVDKSNTGGS